jgi:hypothetical protein
MSWIKGIRSGRCVALNLISPPPFLSVTAVFVTSIDELGNSIASNEDEAKSIQRGELVSRIQGRIFNGCTIDIICLNSLPIKPGGTEFLVIEAGSASI